MLTPAGPSGCGKTTTLRMLRGLKFDLWRDLPGESLVTSSDKNLFVPPRSDAGCVPELSDLAAHDRPSRTSPTADDPQAQERRDPHARVRVLELLGLESFATPRHASECGQQQRVAIRACARRTARLLLLDEPLSNLDAKLRRHARGAVCRLQKHLKFTTVLLTQIRSEALVLSIGSW